MLTAQQRQSYIDQIRELPEQITALVNDLSEEQLTTPYLAGGVDRRAECAPPGRLTYEQLYPL